MHNAIPVARKKTRRIVGFKATKPFCRPELLARVRTHLALKTSRDHLERLVSEKSELMAILAHDLKNPLAAINLAAQTIRSKENGTPAYYGGIAGQIENTVSRMQENIENLLAEKASERAEFPLTFQSVLLQMVVAETVNGLRRHAAAKNIAIRLNLPALPVPVVADSHALRHVLDNLISNALKFSPPGSFVDIAISPESGPMHGVQVVDEGPGLTEKDMPHLFEKYSRLSARPTGGESSTGLGLAIVRLLMARMWGTVCGGNREKGKGAIFTLQLPSAD